MPYSGTNLLDVVMEKLDGAKRYERYVAGICPFHSDSQPSLLVYEDGFHCTACGKSGSISYLLEFLKVGTLRPVVEKPHYYPSIPKDWDNERLARSAHSVLMDKPGLQQYLIDRGLEKAIRKCLLGYWDGWYTVPIVDENKVVDEIVFRAGPWVQEQTGSRFWQRFGQKPRMYCPNWRLLDGANFLFVTFGLFDAITMNLLGYPAVTSTIGKGSFKPEWLSWWERFIVIVPDLEEETTARQLASLLGWRSRVLILNYPHGCKDPNDLLQKDPDVLTRGCDELIGSLTNSRWSSYFEEIESIGRSHSKPGTTV